MLMFMDMDMEMEKRRKERKKERCKEGTKAGRQEGKQDEWDGFHSTEPIKDSFESNLLNNEMR